ncbi:molybdopterin synthase catalytic subunit [Chitinophaga cymbidii]|uniref:Molybdopterin synthase catalytic subunit n=1 Tax=Chitinophaga cymbidii TaxID=1096750 RepID=A0A512REF0_9BACT|nr:molybdenum cofactor biosynthesis protein MoaE [Chitinophaga cymbidii]GEP94077.1 molybdopterin (MPT) converting factor, subunit 2 [Chitinophaga cymbidii]
MEQLIRIGPTVTAQEAIDFVQSPESGGIVTFIGAVRNQTQQKKVLKLFFECYEPMALLELEKIAQTVRERWHVQRIAMLHVTGEKLPGETVVVIAVAAPHRAAAFEACQYAIDTLKEAVPIWKQEFFEDGAVWVAAHP